MLTTICCQQVAGQLSAALRESDRVRVVFAESCTGGLVAATLARFPGMSEYLCGSAVTYRNDTKIRWLEVSAGALRHAGAVSAVVAREMAAGVLEATPESDLAVSVTGHLGPDAPPELDGVIYVGSASRSQHEPTAARHQLGQPSVSAPRLRLWRQCQAAQIVLVTALDCIRRPKPS